jgi:pilus assembly protein CpaB
VRKWSSSSRRWAILGVALAVVAFLLMRGYTGRQRALDTLAGPPTHVLVANVDVARGVALSPSMLSSSRWPSAFVPRNAVRDPGSVEGRVLLAALARGEILTSSRLAPRGGALAALIPEGLLAVPVPSSFQPGEVSAGDRVDVLATFPGAHAHVETVASEIEVLRVVTRSGLQIGPASGGDEGSSAVLILLVEPSQAQELAYARAFADVSIALDGPAEEVVDAG